MTLHTELALKIKDGTVSEYVFFNKALEVAGRPYFPKTSKGDTKTILHFQKIFDREKNKAPLNAITEQLLEQYPIIFSTDRTKYSESFYRENKKKFYKELREEKTGFKLFASRGYKLENEYKKHPLNSTITRTVVGTGNIRKKNNIKFPKEKWQTVDHNPLTAPDHVTLIGFFKPQKKQDLIYFEFLGDNSPNMYDCNDYIEKLLSDRGVIMIDVIRPMETYALHSTEALKPEGSSHYFIIKGGKDSYFFTSKFENDYQNICKNDVRIGMKSFEAFKQGKETYLKPHSQDTPKP